MAVQWAPAPPVNPLALALAMKAKQTEGSSDMERDLQKMFAQQLLQGASDYSPVQSPWQGAARLAQGLVGGIQMNRLIESEKANNAALGKELFGGGAAAAPAPAPMPIPQPNPPQQIAPPPMPAPGPQSMAAPPQPVQMASLSPSDAPVPMGAGIVPQPPAGGNDIVRNARQAIDPIPMPRPNPQALAAALAQHQPAQVMASDGMAAPRPPGSIPNVPGALPPQYVDAIKKFEGYTPKAAWDYKQNSIGYGTRAKHPGEVIDRPEAGRRLHAELGKAAGIVDSFAPGAPEGVRAALTSLTYNAGDKWTRSGLGELVRAGDWNGAQQRLLQYNRAGGQVLPGLASRRQAEAQWFNQGGAPQGGQPVQMAQNIPLPRPRPEIPQQQPEAMPNAPVRLAGLGGAPSPEAPYPPQPAPAPVQMAQALPQQPAPFQPQIPPEVADKARRLWGMGKKGQEAAMELVKPYMRPPEYKPVDLGNEVGFADSRGNVIRREPKKQDTDDIREYNQYVQQSRAAGKEPMPFYDYQVSVKRAGAASTAITNDMRAESSEAKGRGEGVSKRMNSIADDGSEAQTDLAMIGRARHLLSNVDPGSKTAILESFRASTGIAIDPNASNVQAANAILNYMIPRQRIAGSGTTSDRDMAAYRAALPSLMGTPDGNSIVMDTFEGLAAYRKQRADIAAEWQLGDISAKEAQKRMDALPDPFAKFKEMQAGKQGQQQQPQQPGGAPQISEGMTATNPQTGQKLIYRGGQWAPVQ